jgi:uncharacterized protein (TIGR03435 family)
MPALTDLALAVGGSLELSILVKVTLVAALGLIGVAGGRRARASRRYLMLAAMFAAILALPLAIALAPPVGIAMPATMPVPATLSAGESTVDAGRASDTTVPQPLVGPGTDGGSSGIRALGPASLIRLAWLTGVALFLLPVLVMVWQVRALRRTGLPWLAGDAVAESLARAAGISRRVTVLLHEDVEAPMTCGLWRPAILLPRDAPTWNEADLQRALLHELEHVRRFDWPAHILARATCALYWCHPLVWMVWRRFHLEAERACDDAVAERTDRNAYAEQLVLLAQRVSSGTVRPALAMAGRGDLSHRVLAVLDDRQARGRAGMMSTAVAAVAVVMVLAGVSPLKAVDAQQEPEASRLPAEVTAAGAPETQSSPAFEVASVRRSPPDARRFNLGVQPGGRWIARNAPLLLMLTNLYPEYRTGGRIVGGPSWIDEARFDIDARASGDPPPEDMMLMARRLLAERFNLQVHVEPRQVDAYVLVRAHRDGRLGPGLREAIDCQASDGSHGSFAPTLPKAGELPYCGWQSGTENGISRMSAAGVPMSSLITLIQMRFLDRPVLDRTDLAGTFAIDLEFATTARLRAADAGTVAATPGPSMVVALTEQLGLRLESRKEALDVLVIDHVEMPTPN